MNNPMRLAKTVLVAALLSIVSPALWSASPGVPEPEHALAGETLTSALKQVPGDDSVKQRQCGRLMCFPPGAKVQIRERDAAEWGAGVVGALPAWV